MPSFWIYLKGTTISPFSTFIELQADPRRLTLGCEAMLLIGSLYTFTVIGLAAAGVQISLQPWLTISAADYYFWEIFFTLPVLVLGWILAGGLVHLLSK